MKKSFIKPLSLILCAALLAGGAGVYALNSGKLAEEAAEESAAEAAVETAAEKDETVYVLAGADGSVKKIIVSDWIKNTAGSALLSDKSELSGVENVKGEETYTMNGDNMRIWDADGNDIYCQGNIEKELPVKLSVSYKLDGKPISAEELAGKSGRVTAKSVEELIAVVKEVAEAVTCPLVVEGCKNVEKDSELLPKVAEALQGKNALVLSAREENYKAVGAAAGLAYNQKVGAESAVDINLAKQLNVVMTQLGVKAQDIVMNVGSAAVGYGFEYVVSTMDRIKGAALSQNDNMLQMPIITTVADESWSVKEAMASEEDMPEWGALEDRGISMEVQTAAAVLAAGSDAVILKHPQSVATISKMIKELM